MKGCSVKLFGPVLLIAILMNGGCGSPSNTTYESPVWPAQANSSQADEINHAIANLALSVTPKSGDYVIGPEDLLQITLYNIPQSESANLTTPRVTTARVSQQGLISIPLVGDVKAAGLTLSSLERDLTQRYEQYMQRPQVGVAVSEYRQRVSVIGAVNKMGVYELSGPRTLIDILAMAGGVNDKGGTQVHIYRQGADGRESHVIDLMLLASNASLINAGNAGLITMPVQAGDVINVPPAGTFFVDGAVRRPGPYPLGRRYSLTQALATAGGVDRELYSSEVTIFRRDASSGMKPITVDIDNIMAGIAVEPQIQADDVIVVPISGPKYFFKRFVGTMVTGGISIGSFIPAVGGS
jgi:polysaccharide export outer membrane protein